MDGKRIGLAVVVLTGGLFASPLQSAAPANAGTDQPNVVLILVDDARVDDLTTLPKIVQQVGAAGATFNGTISSFPLCCPARASLLTGQYPHNHHVLGNTAPLGGWSKFNDADTLATWLDPAYETGLVGKYFNQYQAPYIPPGWDYWATPRATYNYRFATWSINGANVTLPGYQTDTMGDLAADFITAHTGGVEPFFLYTSIVAPHSGNPAEADDPAMPTPNVANIYRDTFAGMMNTNAAFNEADVSDKPIRPAPLTSAEIAAETEVNAQRRESLLSVQDVVSKIIDTLAATGELDNTYVWFISDNGYLLGEHRIRSGKVAPYEVSARVPMLLRGPGIAAGTVVNQPTALIDFAPTVLAMTAREAAQGPYPMDGVNLLPLISDPATSATRPILIEAGPKSPTAADTDPYQYHGIVATLGDTEWKYVVRSTGRKELYDLASDPAELTNLAGLSLYANAQATMDAMLKQFQWCAGTMCAGTVAAKRGTAES